MRIRFALALAALAYTASAQTLTTGLTPNNGGNIGGGLYFDLTVNTTITLTSLDCWVGAATTATTAASWELWLGPSTYVNNVTTPGLWTKVGTTVPAAATGGVYQLLTGLTITPVPQIAAVTLAPGNYGFAFKSVNCSNGYTNGLTCTSTTVPGSCTNSLFSTPQLTLRAGAAQNAFLTGGIFSPRIFSGNITYTVGGTPITFAQREPYGPGCYNKFRSFYEFFPSSVAVDFSNTSIFLQYDSLNNRYNATAGTTPVVVPTSASLGHGIDNDITVPLNPPVPILYPAVGGPGIVTTSVDMSANGYITLNGTNPAAGNPTIAAFLSGSPRIGYWHNLDPVAGGTTHYEYDFVAGAHLFTWNGCFDSAIAASPNTIQLAFFANGDVEFRFGLLSQAGGGGWPTLIGFTPGGNAADPGSQDITLTLPFSTSGIDQPPLALASDVNPVIGTTVNLTTSNVTGNNLGICFVSVADLGPLSPAGLDLVILGAPGCVANVDTNVSIGTLITNLGSPFPGLTVPFAIPNLLSAVGQSFYCQSAWLDSTQNAFGLLTSNALRLRVGSF